MNHTSDDKSFDDADDASDGADSGDPRFGDAGSGDPRSGGFIWQIIPVLMLVIIGLLAMTLYRRVAAVDPVRRCADAYESSYTPVDTTLVDRIKVRTLDRTSHTTCGELRASGAVRMLPKRNQMKRTMP
jgi:hypothetical protein